jgi:hypothetical protein
MMVLDMARIKVQFLTVTVTILSIAHLLISEVGSFNEDIFDVHSQGLTRILEQRGGISQLDDKLAATFTLYVNNYKDISLFSSAKRTSLILNRTTLCFTILRRTTNALMFRHSAIGTVEPALHEGSMSSPPIFSNEGDCTRDYSSCNTATNEIIHDMHTISQAYLARWKYISYPDTDSDAQIASCENQMHQIYARLLRRPPTEDELEPDWIYESVRLAALLYCGSMVRGTLFAGPAHLVYERGTQDEMAHATLLSTLHAALMRTDTRNCWGEMRTIFLRVCLVGGAASWPSWKFAPTTHGEASPTQSWIRKCFALYAIRAAVSIPFDQIGMTIEGMRNILHIRHWMDLQNGAQTLI